MVGGAFVAVDGEALMDSVAVEIEFLAQGLHDELLQVFGEEHQRVLVGKNHHVFLTLAIGAGIPGEGELHGGIVLE